VVVTGGCGVVDVGGRQRKRKPERSKEDILSHAQTFCIGQSKKKKKKKGHVGAKESRGLWGKCKYPQKPYLISWARLSLPLTHHLGMARG